MIRCILLAGFLTLLATLPGGAQPPAHPAPNGVPQVSPEQARQVLQVLNDPKKRAEFTATLEAIAKLQGTPSAAPAPPAGTEPGPAATPATPPRNVGADLLGDLTQFFRRLSDEVIAAIGTIRSVPLLWGWLNVMATDPWAQGVLLDVAWRLVLSLAAGFAAQWAVRLALRRPREALARHAPQGNGNGNGNGDGNGDGDAIVDEPDGEARAERGETELRRRRPAALTLLLRLPLILARLAIDLLPVMAFAIVAHVVAASALGGDALAHGMSAAVINAFILYEALIAIAEMMFSPTHPRLRLLAISDDTAAYAMRWTRRIVVVGLILPTIAAAGSVLGMSDTARKGLEQAGELVDIVLLGIIVLQQRQRVSRRIAAAPEGAQGPIAVVRNGLAAVWHWLALFLLGAIWLVTSLEVEHGFSLLLRFAGTTVAVLVVGRIVLIVALGLADRLLRLASSAGSDYPAVTARLALYRGVVLRGLRVLVFLVGIIILLQLWGLRTLDWLVGTLAGQQLIGSLLSLAITLLLAVVVWELINAAIERHLARLAREAQGPRSARLRTLLPLLRTTLMITILTVAALMALSEIGVNIGPLLAGAGIVGVAIGFGSQKLVQDLITGIFLLLENAMQVGDWVTVSGLSGTVENLSVRTIRLRAGDGSVHIVPFSSVTSVTNVNRGIGNASVNVSVVAREDTDRVCEILKDIVLGMRAEPDFSAKMLSDLQLWGVDKLDGASVTIAGQVVCTDSGRWSVQREFNRRMKQRFEELGIELYSPVQRMVSVTQMTKPPPEGEPA